MILWLLVCWLFRCGDAGEWRSEEARRLSAAPGFGLANLSLTLVAPIAETAVPAVLAFETGNSSYPDSAGMVLRLHFERHRVTPLLADDTEPGPELLSVNGTGKNGSQGLCGQVIREAWSEREELGFPVPQRCRFAGTADRLTLIIEFEPRNCLVARAKYQLVLNVRADTNLTLDQDTVLLLELANPSGQTLFANSSTEASAVDSFGSTSLDSSVEHLRDFRVDNGSHGSSLAITDSLLLPLRFQGERSSFESSRVRLLLWPLTQWHLQQAGEVSCREPFRCSAQATAHALDTGIVSRVNSVLIPNLTVTYNVSLDPSVAMNVVLSSPCRASLSADVSTNVNVSNSSLNVTTATTTTTSTSCTVIVSNANYVPDIFDVGAQVQLQGQFVGGVFAARPAVVVRSTGTFQYLEATSGPVLYKSASGFGMIVTLDGEGNLNRFTGQDNSLYLRLILAAGLPFGKHIVVAPPAELYNGSQCGAVEFSVPEDRLPAQGALQNGSWQTASNLSIAGFWPGSGGAGCGWMFTAQSGPSNRLALWRGSSVYLKVSVTNPNGGSDGTSRDGWRFALSDQASGFFSGSAFRVPASVVLDAADPAFGTKVSITTKMGFAQVLPGNVLPGETHDLQVFFTVSTAVYPRGAVAVEAPAGFSFPDNCSWKHLGDEFYRNGAVPGFVTLERLPRVTNCRVTGSSVLITVNRPLQQGLTYGFAVKVQNPRSQASQADQLNWAIRTLSADLDAREASVGGAAWVTGRPGSDVRDCWGLYSRRLDPPVLRWGELSPFFLTMVTAYVTVFPLQVPIDVTVPVQLTAPLGWVWDPGIVISGYWQDYVAGATARFPEGAVPVVHDDIYLRWDQPLFFNASFKYGFRVPVRVPWWPTTGASFILELGFRNASLDSGQRPLAVVIPGPTELRAVRGAWVDYLTGRKSETQGVRIQLTIPTPLYADEGFVFEGGAATKRLFCECPAKLDAYTCEMTSEVMSGQIVMLIRATQMIQAGTHSFLFPCTNPANDYAAGTWKIGSYQNPQDFGKNDLVMIHAHSTVPGFAIQNALVHFGRLSPEITVGFDPRPLRNSSNIFAFTVVAAEEYAFPSRARLRAPLGTQMRTDCLDQMITNLSAAFPGNESALAFYKELPEIFSCEGRGSLAELRWEVPLRRNVTFALRVNAVNPEIGPTYNTWTLEVDVNASAKEEGAIVQTFYDVELYFAANATQMVGSTIGSNLGNKMRMQFTPSVPAEAMEILAPEGFDFGDALDCDGLRLTGKNRAEAFPVPFVVELSGCNRSSQIFQFFMKQGVNLTPAATYTLDTDIQTAIARGEHPRFKLASTGLNGSVGDEVYKAPPSLEADMITMQVNPAETQKRSGVPIDVQLKFAFNDSALTDDTIKVRFPPGYTFDTSKSECPVTLSKPSVGPPPECYCLGTNCEMTFKVPAAPRRLSSVETISEDSDWNLSSVVDSDSNETNGTASNGDNLTDAISDVIFGPTSTTATRTATSMSSTSTSSTTASSTATTITNTSTTSTTLTTTTSTVVGSCAVSLPIPPTLRSVWPCGAEIIVNVVLIHPTVAPNEFDNMWVAELRPAPVKQPGTKDTYIVQPPRSQSCYRGWSFETAMSEPVVSIMENGVLRAGAPGAVLEISFIPANPADQYVLDGKAPLGWDFRWAKSCEMRGTELVQCEDPFVSPGSPQVLVVRDVAIRAAILFKRQIRNVQLARSGGQAAFELSTFTRGQMGDQLPSDASGLMNSFILPGALKVTEVNLRTVRGAVTDAGDVVFAQIPPRLSVPESVLYISFTVTQPLLKGDLLELEDPTGTVRMRTESLQLLRMPEEFFIQVRSRVLVEPIRLEVEMVDTVRDRTSHKLRIFSELRRDVVSPDPMAASVKWFNLVARRTGYALPVDTNDGLVETPILPKWKWASSTQIQDFQVSKQVAAPLTQIQVSGKIPKFGSFAGDLLLVAPVGVDLIEPCKPTPCRFVKKDWAQTGRQAAVGLQSDTGSFALRAEMPMKWQNGNRNDWLVLLPGQGIANESIYTVQSWESAASIELRAMPAEVLYPSVALTNGVQLQVSLQPGAAALALLPGGARCYIKVRAPQGYALHCGNHFRSIRPKPPAESLCEAGPLAREVTVALDNAKLDDLADLMFVFGLDTPAANPSTMPNTFFIGLLDSGNVTLDANVAVPAMDIPQPRISGSAAFQVEGFESLAWLQHWAQAARQSGALANCISTALQVAPARISIDGVKAILGGLRRLQQQTGRLRGQVLVNFSVRAEHSADVEALSTRIASSDFKSKLQPAFVSAVASAGLTPVQQVTDVVLEPPTTRLAPNVTSPALRWSVSARGARGTVSVDLIFQRSTDSLRAVLIKLPEGYSHLLKKASDLKVVQRGASQSFPLAPTDKDGSCLETWDSRNVKVILRAGATVASGGYGFEMPFQMPEKDPDVNIWEVSVCSGLYCETPRSPSVVTSFAVSGFNIGDKKTLLAPKSFTAGPTGGVDGMRPSWRLLAGLAVLLLSSIPCAFR